MSTLTVTLVAVAAICWMSVITCGAFAVEELAKIAHRRSQERFPPGGPRFSIWQRQDFRTYIAAFWLVVTTPPMVVADPSCRRWLRGFWLSFVLTVVSIGWMIARLVLP
jgi:hypothetical protein